MYEANPMSLIMREAGGTASDTERAILDIQPQDLHQRVAVVLGSREEVDYVNTASGRLRRLFFNALKTG